MSQGLIGISAYKAEQYGNSANIFEKTNSTNDRDEITIFWLANSYLHIGKEKDAVRIFQNLGAEKLAAYFVKASKDYLKKNDIGQAEYYARLAVEIDPQYGTGYCQLGKAYYEGEKYEEAEAALQKAMKLNLSTEDLSETYYMLGNIYQKSGDDEKSVYSYKMAVQYSPGSYLIRRNLADLLVITRKFDEALYHLYYLLDSNPRDSSILIRIGNIYLDQNRYTEANNWFEKSISVDPDSGNGEAAIGRLFMKTGQLDKAVAFFSKSVGKDPKKDWVWLSLGDSYWRLGNKEKAKESYTWVIDHSTDPAFFEDANKALLSLNRNSK
jgi:tetratricopeptide (TPR) repeat protein